jgi:hypothetical protein
MTEYDFLDGTPVMKSGEMTPLIEIRKGLKCQMSFNTALLL